MKINIVPYMVLQLLVIFVPIAIIFLGFTSDVFKQSRSYVIAGIIIGILALFVSSLLNYFLSPALVYIELQEARNNKVTILKSIKATSKLRFRMYKIKLILLGRFMSKLMLHPLSAFRYLTSMALWPYYLVDKNMPENEVLESAYMDSKKDAANLFGKTMLFSRGWWHALEYLNRQK